MMYGTPEHLSFSLKVGASEHILKLVMHQQQDLDEEDVKLLEDIIKEEVSKLPNFDFEMKLAWLPECSSYSPCSGEQKKRCRGNLELVMLHYLQASSAEYPYALISLNDCVASVQKNHCRNTNSDEQTMKSLMSVIERLFVLLKMKLVLRYLV